MNYFADVDENITGVGKYVPRYISEFAQKYRENYAMRLEEGYSFSESYFEKEDLVKTIHIIQEKMTNSHEDFEFQRNEL